MNFPIRNTTLILKASLSKNRIQTYTDTKAY